MDTQELEPIAIVGSSCRFPGGASTPSKLWTLLQSPRDLLRPIPPERFDPAGFYHPNGEHHGASNVQHSYLLEEDPCTFDAAFFSLNAREADAMDPQHRILLETVYECLENSGTSIQDLQSTKTGVYVGLMTNDYHDMHLRDMETIPKYSGTGTTRSILSNRVSYFFNWKGPSMTIDTACSSSLVAVHLAVQSLRSGETPVAIAAGANLIFGPEMYIIESKLHMLSPQGRSRMWDDQADGYGRGEGVAAVMLKTLSAAIRDGDHIECVIRNTGVNQDGRTPGITMPSPLSQEALIRDTYRAAGLDLNRKEDRPQFFEAHGTGTPVGDPLEAEAIDRAFFGDHATASKGELETLYVGGIKTVIGHLEGAAGLAGLLKASLAIQHKTIPPNLHLNQLNPKVVPFTKNLRIPQEPIAWPRVSDEAVRRASVNSFGFGGTNAHAILESYDGAPCDSSSGPSISLGVTPFVFSASSDSSLVAVVKNAITHLTDMESSPDLMDLSWTLQAKRTEFPFRKSFTGETKEQILENMRNAVSAREATSTAAFGTRPRELVRDSDGPRILGVFTGQGAQWPSMGVELLRASSDFAESIQRLEESLDELTDGPEWSLQQELSATGSNSKLHLAEISQPLCTAVQIALVDLLHSAGIRFYAVVGHSSGEIAAAYAAGVMTARDAIRVAYYRGVHAKNATGTTGQVGSMMAVGASLTEAQALCEESRFAGRLAVAASNAPSTVTISGDQDAIEELRLELEQKGTFARVLKVDKAYHSHHMLPCSSPYLDALNSCRMQVSFPNGPFWVSSVHGKTVAPATTVLETLSNSYWVDNMTRPVMFSQAIEQAELDHGPFDVAIEVGPHAALKGPTTQTIKALTGRNLLYHGSLNRGRRDDTAFASLLGMLWEQFGSKGVQLGHFTRSLMDRAPALLKDLPGYPWDHQRRYWKESRLSKNFRQRSRRVHQLLGTACSDNVNEYDLRWRNILYLDEMPWLRGHKFQEQVLFPAAGHVALALEASKALIPGQQAELIELENISIGKAITLEESGPGVEILFSMKRVESTETKIVADFACYSCPDEEDKTMDQCSSGRLTLFLSSEQGDVDVLPSRSDPIPGLVPVDAEDFYEYMNHIGLDYTGEFRKMEDISRTRNYAISSATTPPADQDYDEELMVHPALLDMCFQTVIAAFCYPGDGSFWVPYLPTRIDTIRVNPRGCIDGHNLPVDIEASITDESSARIVGDLGAYNPGGKQFIQLEGLVCRSFAKETAATDRLLFAETVWKPAVVPAEDEMSTALELAHDDPIEIDAIEVNERVAFYYLRTLRDKYTPEQVAKFEWWYQRLFEFADHLLPIVANGTHQSLKAEWFNDTYSLVQGLVKKFPDQIDLQLLVEVGENLPTYVRGKLPLLEVMLKEDRLTRLYQDGLGVPQVNEELSKIAKQLSHQFPNMKILEIGAGTGGMTHGVLDAIDGAFGSYTFTDISSGFFEKARARLQEHDNGKLIFSALDIEKDPVNQGYTEASYDVIIASNVLHATRKLQETMENVRRLLRPGGYLLLNEVTGDMLRLKFIMSGLPGWWLGGDDNRRYSPTINPLQWDQILRDVGFSGVDIIRRDYADPTKQSLSVMVSQAMDEMVEFLREPLLYPYMAPEVQELFVVGGKTLPVRQIARAVANQLRSWAPEVSLTDNLLTLKDAGPEPGFTVVCLDDLDEHVLQEVTPEKLSALQFLFSNAKHILYVTRGAREDSPYSMAIYGLGRTMTFEHPDLQLQFLDITKQSDINARILADELLRLVAAEALDPSYLWTAEPELSYLSGQKQIQRVVPNRQLNDRLNADRRLITEAIPTTQWQIVLSNRNEEQASLYKGATRESLLTSSPSHTRLDTIFSMAHPVKAVNGSPFYLSVGKTHTSPHMVAAITSQSASSTTVSTQNLFILPEQKKVDVPRILQLSSMWLVMQNLFSLAQHSGPVILHEPDVAFANFALSLAAESGLELSLTTRRPELQRSKPWTWIHPYGPKSQFKGKVWSQANVLINFADNAEPLGAQISGHLKKGCLVLSARELLSLPSRAGQEAEDLLRAVAWACTNPEEEFSISPPVLSIKDLQSDDSIASLRDLWAVIDWEASSAVTVPVQPTITDGLFSAEKTYILFGLSGDIGRSLAEYMANNGARHIVLTSRHPPSVDAWVKLLKSRGVTVKLLANDITNKEQVKSLVAQVSGAMPPVGGVVNGAMVLQDKLFSNMNIEDWNAAVKPKIDGSRHLDECFSHDRALEFFVMLSSLASIIGNSGQSNYNVGNMYCASLAANRRKRGLAASVIDIGKIVGIGYVARNRKAVISLRSHKFQPISEPLFHHMFAEAVISGRPDSGRQPVLTSGMQKRVGLAEEDSAPPLWLSNPRFSHMKWEDKKDLAGDATTAASARVPVIDQLKTATQVTQAESMLCTSFATRLAAILQMSVDSIPKTTPLVDVGIDSLIAVEVRSWFLKELTVDVPVLRIIGGASILDICRDVLGKLALSFEGPELPSSPPNDTSAVTVNPAEQEKSPVVNVVEVVVSDEEEVQQDESSIEVSTVMSSTESVSDERNIPTPTEDTDDMIPEAVPDGDESDFTEYDNVSPSLQAPKTIRSAPLSHAQERMWLAHRYSDDPSAYNVAFGWKLQGRLNHDQLEAAFLAVVQRHEALHSGFRINASTGEPEQFSFAREDFVLGQKMITKESDVHDEFLQFRDHVFDLENGDTLKATVLQLSGTTHILLLCYHHIVMDGNSLMTFLGDLNQAYVSRRALSPASQYLDYAIAERELTRTEAIKEDLEYWKQQFKTPVDPLPLLPFSRVQSRPPLSISDSFTAHAFIKKETVARIKDCSRHNGSTAFHFYAAALQIILYQLLDGTVDDFCIGIADANRHDDRYLDTVGFCLNLLPLRFRVHGQDTMAQLLKKTRTSIFRALAHSRVPFDVLLEELKVPRSSTSSPLFQVLLNYTLGIQKMNTLASCEMAMVEIEDARSGCDLVISIVETAGQDTALSFTMPPYLYLDQDCARLLDIYVELVDQLSKFPERTISQVTLHPQLDSALISTIGHGPVVEEWEGWETTISRQVDVACRRYPGNIAVKIGLTDTEFSYEVLNELVGRAARGLKDLNIGNANRVAILGEPSINMIVFILAILRVGAAYVPLDPRNPHQRLSSIIGDVSLNLLLSDGTLGERASLLGTEHAIPVKWMELLLSGISPNGLFEENVSVRNDPAVVLYTSGSTGTPKGIMLDHRNWVNQFAAITQEYGLVQERVLQQSSPGFDMAIEQVFIALCNGGTVVLTPSSARGDAVELARLIMEERITYTMAVPSEYSMWVHHGADWLRRCNGWKYAFSGGEKVTDHLRVEFKSLALPHLQLINVYGPTEVTVSCCRGKVPLEIDDRRNGNYCPVGRTLPNYQVHIVDSNGRSVPAGFPGEVYISGLAVGRGYLNQPELTDAKFLSGTTNFTTLSTVSQSDLIYRTGDRGRLLNDGTLVFLGRLEGDSQIKLRGQRVELDEIAHALLHVSAPVLANAHVSARGTGTDIFLVAFVVFAKDAPGEEADRTSYLKQLRHRIPLPRYMWPSVIIALEKLPLSVNGKVDRKALDAIELPRSSSDDRELPDLSNHERALLELWQEVLPDMAAAGLNITKDTDFFEAGGNSLSLVRLQSLVTKRLGIQLPLVEFVEFCSLDAMARRLWSTDSVPSTNFSWEDEANIVDLNQDMDYASLDIRSFSTTRNAGKVVILTGASGFLGKQILQDLISSTTVSKVHCLAVRSLSSMERLNALESSKIVVHAGNLTLPRLGLDIATARSLASTANIIIHNGADVSFLKSYSSLKKANVQSTAELIHLAKSRQIPIHFISSAGVAGFVPRTELPLREVSVASYPPPTDMGAHGYQVTKWVSERLLEKASKQYGLDVILHRPTGIVGEESPSADILGNLLHFSRQLGLAPDMDGWDGNLDLVNVEVVAQRVVAVVESPNTAGTGLGRVQVVHTCNPDAFPVHELGKYLERAQGQPFNTLPMFEWIDRAMQAGMNEMVGMYLQEVTSKRLGWYPPVVSGSGH